MLNQVVLIGRMVRDPESRDAGKATVTSFTIAVDRQAQKDSTDFINIEAWNKLGELVSKYCGKGSLVAVTGELNIDKYESKGVTKYSAKIKADNVRFLDKPGEKSEKPKDKVIVNPGNVAADDDSVPF